MSGSGLRYGVGAMVTSGIEVSSRKKVSQNGRSVGGQDEGAGVPVHRCALGEAKADLGVGHLPRTAFPAELAGHLDGVHAVRHPVVAVGEEATVGVARHGAAELGVTFTEVLAAFADLAEAELLQVAEHRDGEAVVEPGDVDVV